MKTLAPERGPTSTLGRRTTHVCGVVEFAGDEHRLLRERARKAGRPLAVYIREAALGVQLARVANRSAYRELTRVGTNLKSIGAVGEHFSLHAGAEKAACSAGRAAGSPAKVMIAKVTSGSDFGGLARYLTYREDRVGLVELQNTASRDVREAAQEMQITAELSSRCKKPVYHLSLSFDPGDQPSEEQLRSAASRVLKELNLDTYQAVVVLHWDTAHLHVHVMVNRLHAETGKPCRTSHDWRRIERALRKLEKEWSLREVPGRHSPSKKMSERRISAFTQEFRDKVGVALHKTGGWTEYRAVLDHHNLEMKLRPQGLVLSDGRSYASAGQVSESLPALNQRFRETLQENHSRLVDARMMPLAVSQRNSDIIQGLPMT